MDKDEFIAKERAHDAKKRERFLKGPLTHRISRKVKGSLTKDNIVNGTRRAGTSVRGGIQRAAEYQPSKQTKARINELGKYARSEATQAGRSFGRSIDFPFQGRSGGGRGRRSRRRSYSYQEDEEGYSGGDISGYAESFAPPSLRFDPYGRPTGRMYETDMQSRAQSVAREDEIDYDDGTDFVNPYADYISNFDPFSASQTAKRGGKRGKSTDLIGRWFS